MSDEPRAYDRVNAYRGQLLRRVVCDDGVERPNRTKCRREGRLKTKRQKRLERRKEARRG